MLPLPLHAGRIRAIPAAAPSPPIVLSASRRFIIRRAYGNFRPERMNFHETARRAVSVTKRARGSEPPCETDDTDTEPDGGADARGERDEQDTGHRIAVEPAKRLGVARQLLAIRRGRPAPRGLDRADDHAGREPGLEHRDGRDRDRR